MPVLPLVRVRLKYPDAETLVERFAPNVTRGGIFLASREPRAVGAAIRFEVSLLSGAAVLAGEGKVTWVKPFDPANPGRPHGMGVSFTKLDPSCREMWKRLLDRRDSLPARGSGPIATRGTDASGPLVPGGGDARTAGLPGLARDGQIAPAYTAELEGIEEGAFRRATDRARALAGRVDKVEDLLVHAPDAPATLAQALADLPRYLQTRRPSGSVRVNTPLSEPRTEPAAAPEPDDKV